MKSYKVVATTKNAIIVKGLWYDAHRSVTLYLSQEQLTAYQSALDIKSCDELNNDNVQTKTIENKANVGVLVKPQTSKLVGAVKNGNVEKQNRKKDN